MIPRTDWCSLLSQFYDAAQGDLSILLDDNDDERYYSTEASRSWFLHHEGKTKEALLLLTAVSRAKPESTYMEVWGLDWAEEPSFWDACEASDQLVILGTALNRFAEFRETPEPMRRHIARYAALAERVKSDEEIRPMLNMSRAGFYRKAGLFDKGLQFVRDVRKDGEDNWHTAVAEGLILRQMDECDLAEVAFQDALRFDPDDRAARLEAADMYFERQNWQPALEWYQSVLDVESDHDWAYPSALWCQWRLKSASAFPDDHFPKELGDLIRAQNHRANQLTGFFRPFLGYLPQPSDATANLLREITNEHLSDAENRPEGEIKLTISSLEAPSNFLAFNLEMAALKSDCTLDVTVSTVPKKNDPRKPIEPVRWTLWTYDDTTAHAICLNRQTTLARWSPKSLGVPMTSMSAGHMRVDWPPM